MKENKIGIVTWYKRGHNFGSSLQAYAMQQVVKKYGSPECINYNQEHRNYILKIKTKIKNIYLFIFNRNIYKTWKKYDKWIKKHIVESKKVKKYKSLKKKSLKYSACICGSDQIWNNDLKCDPFYFLRFIEEEKRIAYAPSIGRNYLDDKLKNSYKKYIEEIPYLSIREETGQELIKRELNIDVKVCLDPTFLLTESEWKKIINNKEQKDKYIFVYLLKPEKEKIDAVKIFANKNNLKVIIPIVSPYYKYVDGKYIDQSEFLEYIANAELVITDSFHGVAFSIIFNKKMMIYKRFNDTEKTSQNSRIDDLIKKLEISSQVYISSNKNISLSEIINYKKVNEILSEKIDMSKRFLMESLEKIMEKNYGRN